MTDCCWAGALVSWLREETHNQKVVSSNPGAGYRMEFFTFIYCENCNVCLKRTEINEKEAGVGPYLQEGNLM